MSEKTVIEEQIRGVLGGDAIERALDFTAFLRAHSISPDWHSGNGWSLNHGSESIGFMLVDGAAHMPGPWTVWFNSCDFDESAPVDDAVKETAWAHSSICGHFASGGKECGCGNQPGFSRVMFGRAFENRCHSPLMFTDPDAQTLGHVKQLMLLLKK